MIIIMTIVVIIIGRVAEMIRMIMIIKIQRFIDIILALITHLYPPLCPSLSPFPLSVSSSLLSLPPLSSSLLNSPLLSSHSSLLLPSLSLSSCLTYSPPLLSLLPHSSPLSSSYFLTLFLQPVTSSVIFPHTSMVTTSSNSDSSGSTVKL